MSTPPARPRDAASLVLIDVHEGTPRVLMGRRARRHRFMPDFYVFPGGSLDRADYRARVESELRPEVEALLRRAASPGRARALAVAAVRETWEETGLAIGRVEDGRLLPALAPLRHFVRAITPTASPIRFHARFFVVEAKHAQGVLQGNGELLDLAWRPAADCLRLPVTDITEYILHQVRHVGASGHWSPHAPLFAFRRGKAVLLRC